MAPSSWPSRSQAIRLPQPRSGWAGGASTPPRAPAAASLAAGAVGRGGEAPALVRVDRPRGHFSVDEIVADLVELAAPIRPRPPPRGAPLGIGVAGVGVVPRARPDGRPLPMRIDRVLGDRGRGGCPAPPRRTPSRGWQRRGGGRPPGSRGGLPRRAPRLGARRGA